MEAVAYTFVILVVLLALLMFVDRFQEIIGDIGAYLHIDLDYVKPAIQQMIEPPRVNPQSYAVNRPQTASVSVDKPQFEPTDLTPDELVQLLALITVVRDGARRQLSQEVISRAAGMSKVTAAVMIAEARGQPEPVAAVNALHADDPRAWDRDERNNLRRIRTAAK